MIEDVTSGGMDTARMRNFLKSVLPKPIWRIVRSLGTALITPISFSYRTGHFRSSFQNMSVAADGSVLPWYTYPCIDFLAQRDYSNKTVLEFGAGQSSLWWAARARSVRSIEGDADWFARIKKSIHANAELHLVSRDRENGLRDVRALLAKTSEKYDLVIIDGLWRRDLVGMAFDYVTETGVLILDNSDGRELQERARESGFQRVDFFGFAPGVSKESCTSIFFKADCFLFSPDHPIPKIGTTRPT